MKRKIIIMFTLLVLAGCNV
ncbi:lipoprotein [Alkalihalophilus sp. As8PL]|uniref:Lipoprotein n=1 Tax=Alkalihalophilus sp. As8PL TaxID=3237103 RepID=A0AB39BYF9_9BACI